MGMEPRTFLILQINTAHELAMVHEFGHTHLGTEHLVYSLLVQKNTKGRYDFAQYGRGYRGIAA